MLPTHFLIRQLYVIAPLLCIISLAVSSCAGPSPRERQQERLLERLENSLQRELEFTKAHTIDICRALEDRLHEPFNSEKVKIWQPVVDIIRTSAKKANESISHMLSLFEENTGPELFTKGPWGDSLYRILVGFRYTALNAHERLMPEFEHTAMPQIPIIVQSTDSSTKIFVKENFNNLNLTAFRLMLRYWQKEVALVENKLVTYCFHNTISYSCGYTKSSIIAGQSHSTLSPGETLTITAGVGSFSTSLRPKITIQGRHIDLVDNAYALYKQKVPSKRGNYLIPVRIDYIDESGIEKSEQFNIEYTVR